MRTLEVVLRWMKTCFPLELAEEWDNVGLLLGDADAVVGKIMTCLTVTPEVVAEAVAKRANVVISHHPFPFHPQKTITSETSSGSMILQLLKHDIAVYSPHTAHDNAPAGINEQLAARLMLGETEPLHLTSGRIGRLPQRISLEELALSLKDALAIPYVRIVDSRKNAAENEGVTFVRSVAIACGAADEFLDHAARKNIDVLVLGEARFHTCLQAQARSVSLLIPGHFASEHFAMTVLARRLADAFPDVECWAAAHEKDPISVV